jgi:hypothetical protein
MARNPASRKSVETLKHGEAARKSIAAAGCQSGLQKEELRQVRDPALHHGHLKMTTDAGIVEAGKKPSGR